MFPCVCCNLSLQKMEHEEGEVRSDGQKLMRMTHYYFINYKQFVNVVKYRLDHMRRKLEMEEKRVRGVHVCSTLYPLSAPLCACTYFVRNRYVVNKATCI